MTTFHGLFIGVDRYVSPLINELGGAVRDAEALHALFTDNLGADSVSHRAHRLRTPQTHASAATTVPRASAAARSSALALSRTSAPL